MKPMFTTLDRVIRVLFDEFAQKSFNFQRLGGGYDSVNAAGS